MKGSAVWSLPEGYRLEREVKLSEDIGILKKMAVMQLILAAALIAAGLYGYRQPVSAAFSMGTARTIGAFCFMAAGILVYFLAHEWVHGVFIRLFTGKNAEFGFQLKKGMAYAYSQAYFPRGQYIVIALGPLVVWTVILGLLLKDVPDSWFWYLYVIQIVNVSGAVGDLYVTWLTLGMPKETLIRDNGMEMKYFVKKQE